MATVQLLGSIRLPTNGARNSRPAAAAHGLARSDTEEASISFEAAAGRESRAPLVGLMPLGLRVQMLPTSAATVPKRRAL